MKACFRYLGYLTLLGVVLISALIAVLLVPGVQKSILLRFLPADSTVEEFRVTPGSLRVAGLRIDDGEGSRVGVEQLETRLRPLRWFTTRTVWIDSVRGRGIDFERLATAELEKPEEPASAEAIIQSIVRGLRELEAMRLRLVVAEVALEGIVSDPTAGTIRYEFQVNGIAPGEEGALRFAGTRAARPLSVAASDQAEVSIEVQVRYTQSADGGPERISARVSGSGMDSGNRPFLALSSASELVLNGKETSIALSSSLELRLTTPALLDPALADLGPVSLDSNLDAVITAANKLRLDSVRTLLVAEGLVEMQVDLAQPLELNLNAFPVGPILSARFIATDPGKLPLPADAGFSIVEAKPVSFRFQLHGASAEQLQFTLDEVAFGPMEIRQDNETALRELSMDASRIRGQIDTSGELSVDIPRVRIFLEGRNSLQIKANFRGNARARMYALDATADLRFAPILQQPLVRNKIELPASALGNLILEMEANSSPTAVSVNKLLVRMTDRAGASLLETETLQHFSVDLSSGNVSSQEPANDLVRLRLNSIPPALLRPFLPGELDLRYESIQTTALLAAPQGGLELRFSEPLVIDSLQLRQSGEPIVRGLRISSAGKARVAPGSWAVDGIDLRIGDANGEFLTLRTDASGSSIDWMPDFDRTSFDLLASGSLTNIVTQPVLRPHLQRLRSGTFELKANSPALSQSVDLSMRIEQLQANVTPRGPVYDFTLESSVFAPLSDSPAVRGSLDLRTSTDPREADRVTFNLTTALGGETVGLNGSVTASRLRLAELQALQAFLQTPAGGATAADTGPSRTGRAAVTAYAPAPWSALRADLQFSAERLVLPNGTVVGPLSGRLTIDESTLALRPFEAVSGQGRVSGEFTAASDPARGRHTLRTEGTLRQIEPGVLMNQASRWSGAVNGNWKLDGRGPTLDEAVASLRGEVRMNGRDGIITALNLETPAGGAAMLGLGLLGNQLSQPGITAFTRTIPHFNRIPYDELDLHLLRAESGEIELRKIGLTGPSLQLSGDGRIAPGTWAEMVRQPMQFSLSFGARGELAEHLSTLGLLQNRVEADGFRSGSSQLTIGGSLNNPDSSSIQQLLWRAALSAVGARPRDPESSTGRTDASDAGREAPPSDLERGIDLLDGLLRRR